MEDDFVDSLPLTLDNNTKEEKDNNLKQPFKALFHLHVRWHIQPFHDWSCFIAEK